MWLFTPGGFYSIVAVRDEKNMFLVRARARKDLQNLFPTIPRRKIIQKEPYEADYKFRIKASKAEVSLILLYSLERLNYSNFKGKISTCKGQRDKLGAYHKIWAAMYDYQQQSSLHTQQNLFNFTENHHPHEQFL